MAKTSYYFKDIELQGVHGVLDSRFKAIGGIKSKHNYYDGYHAMVGYAEIDGAKAVLPVTRKVFFKTSNPSLHDCGARCVNATGQNCECSCRGANHGKGKSI